MVGWGICPRAIHSDAHYVRIRSRLLRKRPPIRVAIWPRGPPVANLGEPAVDAASGRPRKGAFGPGREELIHPDDRPAGGRAAVASVSRRPSPYPYRLHHKDGSWRSSSAGVTRPSCSTSLSQGIALAYARREPSVPAARARGRTTSNRLTGLARVARQSHKIYNVAMGIQPFVTLIRTHLRSRVVRMTDLGKRAAVDPAEADHPLHPALPPPPGPEPPYRALSRRNVFHSPPSGGNEDSDRLGGESGCTLVLPRSRLSIL